MLKLLLTRSSTVQLGLGNIERGMEKGQEPDNEKRFGKRSSVVPVPV